MAPSIAQVGAAHSNSAVLAAQRGIMFKNNGRITLEKALPRALLALRLGCAVVFFYGLSDLGEAVSYSIGVIEMALLLAFLLGFKKTFTYGVMFGLHAISSSVLSGNTWHRSKALTCRLADGPRCMRYSSSDTPIRLPVRC